MSRGNAITVRTLFAGGIIAGSPYTYLESRRQAD
jgi:hypothetical protein